MPKRKTKGTNFRGTSRTLYNPQNVKYLDSKTARKEYQELRRVAMKRQKRLKEAGFMDEITEFELPASSLLSDTQIIGQLLDVSRLLRNPSSLVSIAKEERKEAEEAITQGKKRKKEAPSPGGKEKVRAKSGRIYERDVPDLGDVINKNRQKFGQFMDEARARAGGRLRDSGRVRAAYEEAVSRRMQPKTLMKHFNEYLEDQAKLEHLTETLASAPKAGRLTIDKLKALL